MVVRHPPEPWHLHGSATVGVFLVPVRDLPSSTPPGTKVLALFGRAVVTAAFFRYREPSPLQYGEVMATVLVRRAARLRIFIPQIWVDSEASRDGGRALWAIPKEIARFEGDPQDTMTADGLASLTVLRSRRVASGVPASFHVVQRRASRGVVTPVTGTVDVSLARASWGFTGALTWLSGRRPLATFQVSRFRLTFGRDASRGAQ